MKRRLIALVLLVLAAALPLRAAENALKSGDRVAVCGDSITEQKLYSVFIEDYLLMCKPAAQLTACQFGWSGERAPGFRDRMDTDVLWFKPTVASTCYGMNDGGYSPMTDQKGRMYADSTRDIVRKLKAAGTRLIIVGSPGVVDADTYRKSPAQATMYNKTLAALRDIARQVAEEEKVSFANVYDPMMDVMTKAKAKYGNSYHVAGGDGVHPAQNGHLIMAYAFLKAMGCDGEIGTITFDMAAGTAQATEGHKVLSCQNGAIELESSRYPFCFFGNGQTPDSTRSIIEFFPFNNDLNRFKLVVKGATAQRLKVTFGNAQKEFAAADLAKGINLAAEFLDNPFCAAFAKVDQVVRTKQNFETPLHKDLMHNMGRYKATVPEFREAVDAIPASAQKFQQDLSNAAAAAVAPVKYTIKIEAAQ